MDVRPLRYCDVCGQVDDHPRHVFAAEPGAFPVNQDHILAVAKMGDLPDEIKARVLAEIADTTEQQRHMDCCRDAGCPDGLCSQVLATVKGKPLKGDSLVKHLTSGAVDSITPPAPADEEN